MSQEKRKARYQNRKKMGLCVRCGNPLDRTGACCTKCIEKVRIRQQNTGDQVLPLKLSYYETVIRGKLIEGQVYKFLVIQNYEKNGFPHEARRRLRLIRCYPHIAEFEDILTGIRRAWGYYDIAKLLRGFAA